MQKVLDKENSLHFENFFPFKSKQESSKKYKALIGIGGNIGDVKRRFKKLFGYLQNSVYIDVVSTSPLLKNPPFGFQEQDYFFNGLISIKTDFPPAKLMRYLLYIEKRFKRVRTFKDAPRTLDLDIIFFNSSKVEKENLKIPHPHWKERSSVFLPLILMK